MNSNQFKIVGNSSKIICKNILKNRSNYNKKTKFTIFNIHDVLLVINLQYSKANVFQSLIAIAHQVFLHFQWVLYMLNLFQLKVINIETIFI